MFFNSNRIGKGKLGDIMTMKFIESALLNAKEDKKLLPTHIIFINRGVLLCAKDSNKPNLDNLKELSKMGAKIICCGTCVEYLKLKDKIAIGEIGNAKDIMKILSTNKVLAL